MTEAREERIFVGVIVGVLIIAFCLGFVASDLIPLAPAEKKYLVPLEEDVPADFFFTLPKLPPEERFHYNSVCLESKEEEC